MCSSQLTIYGVGKLWLKVDMEGIKGKTKFQMGHANEFCKRHHTSGVKQSLLLLWIRRRLNTVNRLSHLKSKGTSVFLR